MKPLRNWGRRLQRYSLSASLRDGVEALADRNRVTSIAIVPLLLRAGLPYILTSAGMIRSLVGGLYFYPTSMIQPREEVWEAHLFVEPAMTRRLDSLAAKNGVIQVRIVRFAVAVALDQRAQLVLYGRHRAPGRRVGAV